EVRKPPYGAAVINTRLDLAVTAAVDRHRSVSFERAALGGQVDDAGRIEAVLRRQRASDEIQRLDQSGIERLAEDRDAFREDDSVQAVLQAVVLAADVHLAEGILGHTRCLQNDLVELDVVTARSCLDGLGVDRVCRSSRLGLDAGACNVETLGAYDD